jgi:hypothetical protein
MEQNGTQATKKITVDTFYTLLHSATGFVNQWN